MQISKLFFMLGLVFSLSINLAPCLADDLDEGCKNICSGNGYEDGYYSQDDSCDEGYESVDKCCCK